MAVLAFLCLSFTLGPNQRTLYFYPATLETNHIVALQAFFVSERHRLLFSVSQAVFLPDLYLCGFLVLPQQEQIDFQVMCSSVKFQIRTGSLLRSRNMEH